MRISTTFLSAIFAFSIAHAALADNSAAGKPAMTPIPGSAATPPAEAPVTNVDVAAIKDAPLPGDFTMGKKNAPVIMIEYASMSCPHCAHFSNTVMPDLQKKYIDTGKVLYILRQFPLNEPALKAAQLLECVGEKDNDQYYVFARVLFDGQVKWAYDGNYMSGLETFANVGGVSKLDFQRCMNDKAIETKVLEVKKIGNDDVKVSHTPYIIINGELYNDGYDFPDISRFIDEKLAKKK